MPRYEITSPEGKKFEITAPEGATQDQVMAYAKEQLASQQPVQAQAEVQQLEKSAANIMGGVLRGGIYGIPSTLFAEGQKLTDKAAYDVGGKVTDATGSPAAGLVANVAVQAPSAFLGGIAGKATAAPAMVGTAKSLMHQALKPRGQDLVGGLNSDAAKAIQTMLDEGANVSAAGSAKLRAHINKIEAEVQKTVSESTAVVDKAHVMSEVHQVLEKFRNQVNPSADVQKILKSWEETTANLSAKIPVRQAHDLKQGTYKVLSDKYAKTGAVENEASTQAQMAAARGLRLGTEEVLPQVAGMTAKESALINALEMTERRAGISGNKDIAGIAWLAQNPAAATAMMMDRSSAFKSWLANRIYQMRNAAPTAGGAGAVGAYQGVTQND